MKEMDLTHSECTFLNAHLFNKYNGSKTMVLNEENL